MTKKSIFEGTGGSAENSSKTWSKCHFLLLYRRKRRQKVVKKCSNPGGQAGPSKWPPEAVFHKLLWFYKKLIASSNLNRSCSHGSVSVFKNSESTTKLVTAHAESIFRFGFGFLKTWGALVELEWLGLKIRFMNGNHCDFHSWSSTRIAINIWLRFLAIVGFFFSSISLQEDNEFSRSYD